jgi:hypothetical protein
LVFQSYVDALISFVACLLVVLLLALALAMRAAKRGEPPRRTYWDLTEKRFRNDRSDQ